MVSRITSSLPPARRICAASSHSSGPPPASTVRPIGTRPCALSVVCAPPALITPGRVQPGMGNGRSSEPVAMITRPAWMSRAWPAIETPTRRVGSRLHTVAPFTISAPLVLGLGRQLGADPIVLAQDRAVLDGAERDGAIDLAADAGILVEQHGRQAGARRQRRRGKACRAAADHDEVVGRSEVGSLRHRPASRLPICVSTAMPSRTGTRQP